MRVCREMENDQIGYRRGVEGAAPYDRPTVGFPKTVGGGAQGVPKSSRFVHSPLERKRSNPVTAGASMAPPPTIA